MHNCVLSRFCFADEMIGHVAQNEGLKIGEKSQLTIKLKDDKMIL